MCVCVYACVRACVRASDGVRVFLPVSKRLCVRV